MRLIVPCVVAVLVGCGSGTVGDTVIESTPAAAPPVKAMLEEVAESGQLGSGAMEIRDTLENMKAAGEPKAEELLSDMTKLEGAGSPDAIKKQAKAMADKL